jgi:hypothetical protein
VERARLPTDSGKPIHILEMEDHSVFHTLQGGMILRAVLLPPLRDYSGRRENQCIEFDSDPMAVTSRGVRTNNLRKAHRIA